MVGNSDDCERVGTVVVEGIGIVVEVEGVEVEGAGRPIIAPAPNDCRDGSGYCGAFQFKTNPSFNPVPIGPRFDDDDAPFFPFFFPICLPAAAVDGSGGTADDKNR